MSVVHLIATLSCIYTVVTAQRGSCSYNQRTYQNGQVIEITSSKCTFWGAGAHQYTETRRVCRSGSIKTEDVQRQCASNEVCCQQGNFQECAVSCDSTPGKQCWMNGRWYDDGKIIQDMGTSCGMIWGAGAGEYFRQSLVCNDGNAEVERNPVPCAHGRKCCQMPDIGAICMDSVQHLQNCPGTGAAAESEEVDDDISGAAAVSAAADGAEPMTANKGAQCWMHGKWHNHGATIEHMGTSCGMFWGGGESEYFQQRLECNDGNPEVVRDPVPCAHGRKCCQVPDIGAVCMDAAQHSSSCPATGAAAESEDVDDSEVASGAAAVSAAEEVEAFHGGGSGKKGNCKVNGNKYKNGEVIKTVSSECTLWGAGEREYSEKREVCRSGKVKTETVDRRCGSKEVCCQNGKFAECSSRCDSESNEGDKCWMNGRWYDDGDTIDYMGTSCGMMWGAGESEYFEQRLVCNDGKTEVVRDPKPCGSGRKCCQMPDVGAVCMDPARYLEHCNFPSGKGSKDKEDKKGNKNKNVMEVYGISEFSEDVNGEVTVDQNGNIQIDLDVSSLDVSECDGKESDVSFLYHIDEEWRHSDSERYGSSCDSAIGNVVFDPFETDTDCDDLDDKEDADYFNCRLGDLSGRFRSVSADDKGKISESNNLSYSSSKGKGGGFCGSRLSPEAVYGKSIVFRCNDNKETVLFCGEFTTKVYDEGRD